MGSEGELVGVLRKEQRLEGGLQRVAGGASAHAAKKLANQRRRRALEVQLADLDRLLFVDEAGLTELDLFDESS